MILRRIALTLVVAACAFAQTTTTTTRTTDITVGPVGVGSTEVIQVNVANLAANPTTGTAASCTGSIAFNTSGNTAVGSSTPFTLTAGQISSVSLPFSKIASSGIRVEVFAVIGQTTTSSSDAPCDLRYSLETYDSTTGATHIYLSSAAPVAQTPVSPVDFGGGQQGGGQTGGGQGGR